MPTMFMTSVRLYTRAPLGCDQASKMGIPLAFLDGRLITEMRTAAVSAAVTKYLAPDNSSVLTQLGSIVQADAHLEALRRVWRFEMVRLWSRKRIMRSVLLN